jgi:NAD(P)H-dependent flavin oxidoreductase YrpB (nitropropane dioxygenase family)
MTAADPVHAPPLAKLDRAAIEAIRASGRHLLVQGAMGIHASDGLSGKVAACSGPRLVGVGTISAVVKSTDQLLREIRRAKAEARGGFVGLNLMAAINKAEFEAYTRVAIAEKLSFVVQGAGISREIIKWCRAGGIPFAGIVSSGRLAAMYEKWGADFLVAEGSEAGGHIGDVDEPLPQLVREVLAHTRLPVVAAGGVVASDIPGYLEAGAAGVQLASRFLACSDGDVHPNFKAMHLGRTADDIVLIKSCVKGMSARAVRNEFTEALAAGKAFPPVSKTWHYGPGGYHGRTQPCVECLAENICLCRESDFQESFCITDALLASAVHGDVKNGLYYTGSSITRIPERDVDALPSVQELMASFEAVLAAAPAQRRAG